MSSPDAAPPHGPSPSLPGLRMAGVLLIVFAALILLFVLRGRAPQINPGGRFAGEIPGLGPIQIDLWRHDRRWTAHWWSGDRPTSIWIQETAPGQFEGSIPERRSTNPPPSIRLNLENAILTVQYIPPGDHNPPRTAQLRQTLRHLSLSGQTGIRAGRLGARKRFSGIFPALDDSTPFLRTVQDRMRAGTTAAADSFLAGALRHQWDALRLLWPAGMRNWFEWTEWQPHLISSNLVSVSVWSYRQSGGAGNWNRWSSHNFWWNGTQTVEFDLPDLFPPGADWEGELRRRCHADLRRQQASGADAILSTNDVALRTFCLTPRHLVLLFNPYEVGSGAEGEFRVVVPREQLRSLLRRDGPAGSWLSLAPAAESGR